MATFPNNLLSSESVYKLSGFEIERPVTMRAGRKQIEVTVPKSCNAHLIRVLVADDHAVARVGITTIVNAQRDMKVVAVAANGNEAVTLYSKTLPDVALLDIRMPEMSGIDAALAIRAQFPDAKTIALTSYGGDEDIRRAVAAGIKSYLTKDTLPNEVLRAIRMVHAGEAFMLPALAPVLSEASPRPGLTSREF